MLLDNLEEEGILENGRDDSSQCFYLKESIESYTKRRKKASEIIDSREDDTQGRPILEMLTPLPNQNISGDIKELEDFFDRQPSTCLKSKNNKKDNVSIHVCQQLFFSQEGQLKSQRELFLFLRKELESKQRVIDKTLTVCLETQSSMRDERYFSSQSQKFNFTQNKLEKSVITINDNKETFNAHKELASNNRETINVDERTIKDDIQTNVYQVNCNEETDTNFDNNNTVLQVNVNNNESTSKDTPEHQNKDNYQEKICTTVSQNAPPNEKETS